MKGGEEVVEWRVEVVVEWVVVVVKEWWRESVGGVEAKEVEEVEEVMKKCA